MPLEAPVTTASCRVGVVMRRTGRKKRSSGNRVGVIQLSTAPIPEPMGDRRISRRRGRCAEPGGRAGALFPRETPIERPRGARAGGSRRLTTAAAVQFVDDRLDERL